VDNTLGAKGTKEELVEEKQEQAVAGLRIGCKQFL
jgi:hypothetical protein